MTEKQISNALEKIPRCGETKQQKREFAELRCREMINSIMIYGNINSPYNEKEDKLDTYLEERWENEKSIFYVPRERIIELVREQQEDFKKARVIHNVYTDNEGCSYNSCDWGD